MRKDNHIFESACLLVRNWEMLWPEIASNVWFAMFWSLPSLSTYDRWFCCVIAHAQRGGGARLSSSREKSCTCFKIVHVYQEGIMWKETEVNWIIRSGLIGLDGLWNLSSDSSVDRWLGTLCLLLCRSYPLLVLWRKYRCRDYRLCIVIRTVLLPLFNIKWILTQMQEIQLLRNCKLSILGRILSDLAFWRDAGPLQRKRCLKKRLPSFLS